MSKSVVFFINTLGCGGAEHQISILANELAEKGYIVTVTTYGDIPDYFNLSDKIKRIKLAPNKGKIIKLLSIWYYFLFVKADCIISFCQRNNFFALQSLLFRSKRKLKVICGERNLSTSKYGLMQNIFFKILYKRANYIVSNSYSQKSFIIEKYPKYSSKTFTIINYTDLNLFTFHELPNNEPRRIGIFSRYEKQKNCLMFVEAVSKVKQISNLSFSIDWYGNQKFSNPLLKDYFVLLEKRIKDLELSQLIHLNDAVKNVPKAMLNYDIICLPSLFEGFSNSISEAICCGKPMLVSDVSDNSLMVHESENGMLFDPTDIDSIASSIINMLNKTPDELAEMGKRSREIAETLFDKNTFLNNYIKLIEN